MLFLNHRRQNGRSHRSNQTENRNTNNRVRPILYARYLCHIDITEEHMSTILGDCIKLFGSKQISELCCKCFTVSLEVLQNLNLEIRSVDSECFGNFICLRRNVNSENVLNRIVDYSDNTHKKDHLKQHRSAAHIHRVVTLSFVESLHFLLLTLSVLRVGHICVLLLNFLNFRL